MSSRIGFAQRRKYFLVHILWFSVIAVVSGLRVGSLRHTTSRRDDLHVGPHAPVPGSLFRHNTSGSSWGPQSARPGARNRDNKNGCSSLSIVTARYTSSQPADGDTVDSRDNGTKTSIEPKRRWKFRPRDVSVVAVLFAAFLNLLGFTMAGPINPALGKHFSLPLGASFGSLTSAYPLGMMLGVILWPALSDRIGRKPIMAASLMGSGLGLGVQSFGISQGWGLKRFLAARVITGCFAGNSPVSKAYLADTGEAGGDLPKYLAWRDAASTLAFIFGPVLGGLVYELSRRGAFATDVVANSRSLSFVIGASAVASIVASIAIMLFVKETHDDGDEEECDPKSVANEECEKDNADGKKPKKTIDLIACPLGSKLWTGVATVAGVSALYNAADSAYFAFFPSLLQERLGFDTKSVGMAFTSFAMLSFSMSAFVSSRFIRAFGPVAACVTGLGAVATGLMSLGVAASKAPLFSVAGAVTPGIMAFVLGSASMYYAGVPLYGPTIPTMLLQCVPPNQRGAVMGFDGTINTMARVVSPLVMGEIHRRKGAGACFKVAGTLVYSAAALALSRRWLVLRKEFKPVDNKST